MRRKRRSSSGFLSRVGCVFCPASLGAPLLAAAPPAAPPTASQPSLCGRRPSERRPRFMFVILASSDPTLGSRGGAAAEPGEVLFLTLDFRRDSALSSSSHRKSSLLPWKHPRQRPALPLANVAGVINTWEASLPRYGQRLASSQREEAETTRGPGFVSRGKTLRAKPSVDRQ